MNFSPELLTVAVTVLGAAGGLCFWQGRQASEIFALRRELSDLRARVDEHDDLRSTIAGMGAKIDGLIASMDRLRQDMRPALSGAAE